MKNTLLVFLFLISYSALALPDLKADRGRWLQEELELTKNQKKKIKEILNNNKDKITDLRNQTEEAKKNLQINFRSGEKSKAQNEKLRQSFERVRALKTEFHRARFLMALQIRDVLDKDQIIKLNQLKDFDSK